MQLLTVCMLLAGGYVILGLNVTGDGGGITGGNPVAVANVGKFVGNGPGNAVGSVTVGNFGGNVIDGIAGGTPDITCPTYLRNMICFWVYAQASKFSDRRSSQVALPFCKMHLR